ARLASRGSSGHAEHRGSSQEDGWFFRSLPPALRRRKNLHRDRRSRGRGRKFSKDIRSAAPRSHPGWTLCEYGELPAGVPGPGSPRPGGESEIDHHRSFRGNGAVFSQRHHHGLDLPAAPPPGPAGGAPHGGPSDQQDPVAARGPPESWGGNVIQPEPV